MIKVRMRCFRVDAIAATRFANVRGLVGVTGKSERPKINKTYSSKKAQARSAAKQQASCTRWFSKFLERKNIYDA